MTDFDAASTPPREVGECGEIFSLYDNAGRLVSCSPSFSRTFPDAASPNARLCEIYPELAADDVGLVMASVFATGLPRSVAVGSSPDMRRTLVMFRAEENLGVLETRDPEATAEVSSSGTDERDAFQYQALHDVLTGLPNRRQFSDHLNGIFSAGKANQISLMQIDLDEFKPVNDTLGHAAGDLVLRSAADRIRAVLGEADVAYRLAGDEFAVIQRGDDLAAAETMADTIVKAFKEPFAIAGIDVFVGASVGIAIAPEDGTGAEQLMRAADIALYAAKRDGRGIARTFNHSMLTALEQREILRRSLRVALQERQFFIEYQPFAESGAIVGFEALLRWEHPIAGSVPPGVFIPMAEADGLMGEIGEWVLEQACRQASTWPAHFTVSVNLSAAEFLHKGLTDRVAQTLDVIGLAPERLELEITESVLLERTTSNLDTLFTLELLGVRIALDEFGTRYSSLAYLKNFPFDTIKIDRYFIEDVETDEKSQAIVHSIIALAHGLGMRATAEGVENQYQVAWLQTRRCDRLQGNLLGAPMRPERIADFLRESSVVDRSTKA
ncbi:putative bifunctional diguanylate cyclase/phosphodiesterase [Ensifer sp. NPDC090286]|uniref:putative bifunctional diguanylate cyclase/phosphodiesterase n=1 Tax=Ensifer sp. NPDC090286 TaxID=3363991 RepID=UPI00383A855F